ncbi:oligosaccharide flippase family protein [Pseudoalteromonas sp. C2R02]|uniref:oligosaccharide flippase family protein n=1 Tax=Pseudoalteromonas sp. C2R02 TaxID=2841565 RepID=UPI001C0966C0|nr:oligosaccharide flippase family protein [Pseudoalteromonas sp. C2R02]
MFVLSINKIKNKVSGFKNSQNSASRIGRSAAWTFVGFGGSMFLRMVSSLILTRIFMPEIFGLMAIISAITIGIALFSDFGISTSIIQNPKGREIGFLKTAWTLQVMRGFILWGGVSLLSTPLASLYGEAELKYILPVIGFSFVIAGFTSTSIPLHQKDLKIKPIVILELFSQLLTLIFTILLAMVYKNIWAFVFSGLISALIKLIGSYLIKGGVVGFKWQRSTVSEMVRFGKWIFIATIFTFLVGKGDRLLLGTVISKSELGLYNLAALFSQIALGLLSALISKTIMPAIASVADNERQQLSLKFNKVRIYILSALIPLVVFIAITGDLIIKLLYEQPYYNAGWMLQVLSAGMVVRILCMTISPIFLSKGDSFFHMLSYAAWSIIFILSMLLGYYFYGLAGVIFGVSFAPIIWLPIIYCLAKKYVDLDCRLDVLIALGTGLLICCFWWFFGLNINI